MSTHFTEDPRIARQKAEEEEDDDPVTKAIKKTGCLQLHYDVQVSFFILRSVAYITKLPYSSRNVLFTNIDIMI